MAMENWIYRRVPVLRHPFLRKFPMPCLITRQRVSFLGLFSTCKGWSSVDYRPICFLVNDNRSPRNSHDERGIAKSQFPARLGRVSFVVLFESMVDPGALLNRCGVPRSSHGVPPVDGKVTANPMRVTGASTGKMGAAFLVKPMLIEG